LVFESSSASKLQTSGTSGAASIAVFTLSGY